MDRMCLGPRARICGYLVGMALAWLLVACTPMAGGSMPPLFATRAHATPSQMIPTAVISTISPSTTPSLLPTPERTALVLAPATMEAQRRAWLDRVAVSGDAVGGQEWEAIQRGARAEGQVILYSDTARMLTALESFLLVHPGLDGEVHVMTSDDAFAGLRQPLQERTVQSADVLLSGDGPLAMQALEESRLWNYVPADLLQVIPVSMREPLLVHHWSAVLLMQAGTGTETPVDSWWDLTREEWRGRVALPDPAIDKRSSYLFVAFAQHPEELAQSYRTEFGRDLTLSSECPDAACQWIRLFMQNNPRILASDGEVAAWVSDPTAPMKRLGICGSEQLAKVHRGKASMSMIPNLSPAAGLFWPTYLAMVVGGEHPNSAKVLIHWLMSDLAGDGASTPWYEAGHYFPREDVADPPGSSPGDDLEPRLWKLDPQFVLEHQPLVSDWIKSAREDGPAASTGQ